jgi:small ligand-binding sensory domain FIST
MPSMPMSRDMSHQVMFNPVSIKPVTAKCITSSNNNHNECDYEDMLILQVHGPRGAVFHIEVISSCSCHKIHQFVIDQLSSQIDLDASDMYTICNTKLLENNLASLQDIGIKQDGVISVNLRLRGGICVPFSQNQKRTYGNVSRMKIDSPGAC